MFLRSSHGKERDLGLMAQLPQVPAGPAAATWMESFWVVPFTLCHLLYFVVKLWCPSVSAAPESGNCMCVGRAQGGLHAILTLQSHPGPLFEEVSHLSAGAHKMQGRHLNLMKGVLQTK